MNRTDKPKMTSKALIDKLRDEKGVSFKYVTEDNAEKYLAQINNYLRTASYRKNYQLYHNHLPRHHFQDSPKVAPLDHVQYQCTSL